ncbi:LysR family transcriptional regulator [Pandoraea sp. B-6]|uniref:LysR family transcriptional regulator n=1 Tax=Pandoraea sp. B-6 TaxID=1204340 RepID=UPI0018DEE9F7|nr:LysR family transcriptional regulator [Pandoraea sp. B-6]
MSIYVTPSRQKRTKLLLPNNSPLNGRGMINVRHLNTRLRIRHMEFLVALEREGSLHKAAASLGMSQPGASKMLQELETLFDTVIFRREASGLTATQEGQLIVDRARVVLGEIVQMKSDVDAARNGVYGRVRVGVAAAAVSVLLSEAIRALDEIAPRTIVEIQEGSLPWLVDALLAGTLDCVLCRLSDSTDNEKLAREALCEEGVSVVARPQHPLFNGIPVSVANLAAARWILPTRGAPLRDRVDAFFVARGLKPPAPTVESVSVVANLSLLRSDDFLAFLPAPIAQDYASTAMLVVLPTQVDIALPPIGLITRATDVRSPQTDVFLETIRRVATVSH